MKQNKFTFQFDGAYLTLYIFNFFGGKSGVESFFFNGSQGVKLLAGKLTNEISLLTTRE